MKAIRRTLSTALIVLLSVMAMNLYAQQSAAVVYNLFKPGLSIRKTASENAAVIAKVPYGAKLMRVIPDVAASEGETVLITVDGMESYWQKVSVDGKTGYAVAAYLSDYAAPKSGTENLEAYVKQLAKPFGTRFDKKQPIKDMNSVNVIRQLYQNGVVYTKFEGHEYGSDMVQLPYESILAAFNMVKQIKQFDFLFEGGTQLKEGSFTTKDKSGQPIEWEVIYEKTTFGKFLKTIKIATSAQGPYTALHITQVGSDVIIEMSDSV